MKSDLQCLETDDGCWCDRVVVDTVGGSPTGLPTSYSLYIFEQCVNVIV